MVREWEGAQLLADKEAGADVMAIISRASQIYVDEERERAGWRSTPWEKTEMGGRQRKVSEAEGGRERERPRERGRKAELREERERGGCRSIQMSGST